jgi:hypothetical protein
MSLYWSVKSIPELAAIPKEERGQILKECDLTNLEKTGAFWRLLALPFVLAGVFLGGICGGQIGRIIGVVIGGIIGALVGTQIEIAIVRSRIRRHISSHMHEKADEDSF